MELVINNLGNIEKIIVPSQEMLGTEYNVEIELNATDSIHVIVMTEKADKVANIIEDYFIKNVKVEPIIQITVDSLKQLEVIDDWMMFVYSLLKRYNVLKYYELPTHLVTPRLYVLKMKGIYKDLPDNDLELVKLYITRTVQLARAAGIHLIFVDDKACTYSQPFLQYCKSIIHCVD